METYYLYVLQSESTGRYYVGYTKDLEERLRRHNGGRSQFTKARGPFTIVYVETYGSRAETMRREADIKRKKSLSYIRQLIARGVAD